jgi:hypothetical protein
MMPFYNSGVVLVALATANPCFIANFLALRRLAAFPALYVYFFPVVPHW